MKLRFSKDFHTNLEKILKQNKSFSNKIQEIINDFEEYWL